MQKQKAHAGRALTRRTFVQAVSAAGTSLFLPAGFGAATGDLEKDFAAPPDSARMWTWWFWLADRVDRESITADLEELKAKGIGGVTVYSLSGPGIDASMRGSDYMSRPWRELFKHTVNEANRLGLGVSTMLCSGWNAGGPWIQPEHACKQYTHSEMALTGPQAFSGALPRPKCDRRLCRDVAVFAFRTPGGTAKLDAAQQKARDELLAWKSGRGSFSSTLSSGGTLVSDICEAPCGRSLPIRGAPSIRRASSILRASAPRTGS